MHQNKPICWGWMIIACFLVVMLGCTTSHKKPPKTTFASCTVYNGVKVRDDLPRHTPQAVPGLTLGAAVAEVARLTQTSPADIHLSASALKLGDSYPNKRREWTLKNFFEEPQVFIAGPFDATSPSMNTCSVLPFPALRNAETLMNDLERNFIVKMDTSISLAVPNGIHVTGHGDAEALNNATRLIDVLYTVYANRSADGVKTTGGTGNIDVSGLQEQLLTLKQLLDKGLITQEDYDRKKNQLLEQLDVTTKSIPTAYRADPVNVSAAGAPQQIDATFQMARGRGPISLKLLAQIYDSKGKLIGTLVSSPEDGNPWSKQSSLKVADSGTYKISFYGYYKSYDRYTPGWKRTHHSATETVRLSSSGTYEVSADFKSSLLGTRYAKVIDAQIAAQ